MDYQLQQQEDQIEIAAVKVNVPVLVSQPSAVSVFSSDSADSEISAPQLQPETRRPSADEVQDEYRVDDVQRNMRNLVDEMITNSTSLTLSDKDEKEQLHPIDELLTSAGLPKRNHDHESAAEYLYRLKPTMTNDHILSLLKSDNRFKFLVEIRRCIIGQIKMRGFPVDLAFRLFARSLPLPLESQQIDRVCQDFSEVYYQQNPNIYESSHSIYYLCMSMMLLNTEFWRFNSGVWSKEQYVKRALAYGIHEDLYFSKQLCESIYNSVKQHMIEGLHPFLDKNSPSLIRDSNNEHFGIADDNSVEYLPAEFLKGSDFYEKWSTTYKNLLGGIDIDDEKAAVRSGAIAKINYVCNNLNDIFAAHFQSMKWREYGACFLDPEFIIDLSRSKSAGKFTQIFNSVKMSIMSFHHTSRISDANMDVQQFARPASGTGQKLIRRSSGNFAFMQKIPMMLTSKPEFGQYPLDDKLIKKRIEAGDQETWIVHDLESDLRKYLYPEKSSPLNDASFLISLFFFSLERYPIHQKRGVTAGSSFSSWLSMKNNGHWLNNLVSCPDFNAFLSKWKSDADKRDKNEPLILYHGAVLDKEVFVTGSLQPTLISKWKSRWSCLVLGPGRTTKREAVSTYSKLKLAELWTYGSNDIEKLSKWLKDKSQLESVEEETESIPPKPSGSSRPPIMHAKKIGSSTSSYLPSNVATKTSFYNTVAYRDNSYRKYDCVFSFVHTPEEEDAFEAVRSKKWRQKSIMTRSIPEDQPCDVDTSLLSAEQKKIVSKHLSKTQFIQNFERRSEQKSEKARISAAEHFHWKLLFNVSSAVSTTLVDIFRLMQSDSLNGSWRNFCNKIKLEIQREIKLYKTKLAADVKKQISDVKVFPFLKEKYTPQYFQEKEDMLNLNEDLLLTSDDWMEIYAEVEPFLSSQMINLVSTLIKIQQLSVDSNYPLALSIQVNVALLKWMLLKYETNMRRYSEEITSETRAINQLEMTLLSTKAAFDIASDPTSDSAETVQVAEPQVDPGAMNRRGFVADYNDYKTLKAAHDMRTITGSPKKPTRGSVKDLFSEADSPEALNEEIDDVVLTPEPQEAKKAPPVSHDSKSFLRRLKDRMKERQINQECILEIEERETKIELLRIEHEKWRVYAAVLARCILSIEAKD